MMIREVVKLLTPNHKTQTGQWTCSLTRWECENVSKQTSFVIVTTHSTSWTSNTDLNCPILKWMMLLVQREYTASTIIQIHRSRLVGRRIVISCQSLIWIMQVHTLIWYLKLNQWKEIRLGKLTIILDSSLTLRLSEIQWTKWSNHSFLAFSWVCFISVHSKWTQPWWMIVLPASVLYCWRMCKFKQV